MSTQSQCFRPHSMCGSAAWLMASRMLEHINVPGYNNLCKNKNTHDYNDCVMNSMKNTTTPQDVINFHMSMPYHYGETEL